MPMLRPLRFMPARAAGARRSASASDANRNGVLDSDEISSTGYVCNGSDGADGSNGANGTNGATAAMARMAYRGHAPGQSP